MSDDKKPGSEIQPVSTPDPLGALMNNLPEILDKFNKGQSEAMLRQSEHALAIRKAEIDGEVILKSKQMDSDTEIAIKKEDHAHTETLAELAMEKEQDKRGFTLSVVVLLIGAGSAGILFYRGDPVNAMWAMALAFSVSQNVKAPKQKAKDDEDD